MKTAENMNIAHHNFHKHGHASFDVWIEGADRPSFPVVCVAIKAADGIHAGIVDKRGWAEIQWVPEKVALLPSDYRFSRIRDVRIVKSGWFAFATVSFEDSQGAFRAKTDKGFAEFLASISNQIL